MQRKFGTVRLTFCSALIEWVFLAKVASLLMSFEDVFLTNAPLIDHLDNSFY